jgi:signal peptidase
MKKKVGKILNNLIFWAAIIIFVLAVSFVALGKSTEDIYVFGYKPFIIATGSMETEYMTNSMVVIHKGGFEEVKVGDVVAFKAAAMGQKLAFHRVVSQVDGAFVTKGDNNNQIDDALVTKDNFIGREVFHTNITAYWVNELHKPFGWARMILLPILAIIMFALGVYFLNRWTTNKNLKRLIICGALLLASVATLVLYNVWDNNRISHANNQLSDAANSFLAANDSDSQTATTINNREIIGVININRLGIHYPIIMYENEASLDISITKYSGPELNEVGNVALLGHRSANGGNLWFTQIDKLVIDDVVEISDAKGRTLEYKVRAFNIHTPDDLSVLEIESSSERELTLISCSKDLRNRYVVKLVATE